MRWVIWGRPRGGFMEEIDEASTAGEAQELAAEYQLAFGKNWFFMITKED